MTLSNSSHIIPPPVQSPGPTHTSRKDAAIALGIKGLSIGPLCHPDEQGQCGCSKGHTGHTIGKAPTTPHGVKDFSNSIRDIFNRWQDDPLANIGIGLDASGLILVAPDSPEWHERFKERGLPATATAQSGGGEGHLHYFYRAPAGIPLVRINKPDEYDIQSQGYAVAAGSLHKSGEHYRWVGDYQWRDVEDLPYPPQWVIDELQAKWEAQEAVPEIDVDFAAVELRPGLVSGTLEEWWNGDKAATHNDGSTDRSLTLFIIGKLLAKRGATAEEIVSGLRDRDESLGFFKYSQRKDGGTKEYVAIAQKVLASVPPDTPIDWSEITEAVGYDVTTEPFYIEGADAPRRRFTLPTDRGAISKIRERLFPIWLENLVLEGDMVAYDRGKVCMWMPARKCKKCKTTQADGEEKPRYCKLRGCPRCMGVQARRPLWKKEKKALLDLESDLTCYIVQLGSYDVSPDALHSAGSVEDVVDQAYSWLKRLAKMKNCPDTVKTSFSGFRADLHQDWLTLELVLLGPATFGAAAYLRDYFKQATERDVDVEVISCKNTDDAIATFGNLMASMLVYGTVDECQVLMNAFKQRNMVQPRGRFMPRKPKESVLVDSSWSPSGRQLESTSDENPPKRGGGGDGRLPPCHCCGGETVSIGRIAGPWKKFPRGEHSGKPYWYLKDTPTGVRL
jgi:hypothetical protein